MKELPAFRTGKPRVEQGHVQPLDGIDLPFTIIEGTEPGPCLVVTAGVHASEYCSIETAVRLQKTKPEDIKGTLVILPILNTEGFKARSIYLMPQDKKNLNRQLPGKADGTLSERLADWLVRNVYPQANAYLDLHGGDLDESLMPFTIFPRHSEASKALAVAFGLPIAIASEGRSHTIAGAADLGVPSLLPEVSGNGLWGEDTVNMMMAGIERVMKHIGMIDRAVEPPPQAVPEFVSFWVPTAAATGLWYSAVEVGDEVATGETIGEIRDVFGKVLATTHAERPGKVVYRLTSLSVNEGEALLGIGTPLTR